jgi:hypothetical protein
VMMMIRSFVRSFVCPPFCVLYERGFNRSLQVRRPPATPPLVFRKRWLSKLFLYIYIYIDDDSSSLSAREVLLRATMVTSGAWLFLSLY